MQVGNREMGKRLRGGEQKTPDIFATIQKNRSLKFRAM